MNIQVHQEEVLSESAKNELVDFLHQALEKYGDPKSAIGKAITYAEAPKSSGKGGVLLIAKEGETIVGAVVINHTGMEEYIPEHILVYIATAKNQRGKGVGKKLMQAAMTHCEGNIALHVEKDNPAVHLYKKLGFEAPYVEMRYVQKNNA